MAGGRCSAGSATSHLYHLSAPGVSQSARSCPRNKSRLVSNSSGRSLVHGSGAGSMVQFLSHLDGTKTWELGSANRGGEMSVSDRAATAAPYLQSSCWTTQRFRVRSGGRRCRTRHVPKGPWQEPRGGDQGQAVPAPGAPCRDSELAAHRWRSTPRGHAVGRVEDAGSCLRSRSSPAAYGAYLASNADGRDALRGPDRKTRRERSELERPSNGR